MNSLLTFPNILTFAMLQGFSVPIDSWWRPVPRHYVFQDDSRFRSNPSNNTLVNNTQNHTEDFDSKVQRLYEYKKLRLQPTHDPEIIRNAKDGKRPRIDPIITFGLSFMSIVAIFLFTMYMREQQRIPFETMGPAPAA